MLTIFSLKQLKKSSLIRSCLAYSIYQLMRLLFLTLKHKVISPGFLDEARGFSAFGKYIAPIWHQNILSNCYYFANENPDSMFTMVSVGSDGQLLSSIVSKLSQGSKRNSGYSFEGSSSKKGAIGTLKVVKILSSGDESAKVYTSGFDGPRGPIHQPKLGVIQMARLARVPIVALVILPSRYWTLRTWDRFRIPKPFSTVYIHPCKPIYVDADTPKEQFPSIAEEIKSEMMQCEAEIRDKYKIKKHKLELDA